MNIEIGQTERVFDLAEARQRLPLVQKITQKHQNELAPLQVKLNRMLSNDPRRGMFEDQYEKIVRQWRTKIEQLGVVVVGLWVVEFDVGEGCLSWRHPELSLQYFRPHGTNFADRVRLPNYIEENDPDWAR